jgi:hypothetical protein
VITAAWVGYAVEILVLYFGVRNKFELRFNAFKLVIAPIVMAIVILVAEPLFGNASPILVHGLYILVAFGLLSWAYRNELKVFQWNKILK